jgi:hypothetical protein
VLGLGLPFPYPSLVVIEAFPLAFARMVIALVATVKVHGVVKQVDVTTMLADEFIRW